MFSRLCIRKPVTTVMVTLMVFIAGIVSYMNLDQALMPNVDLPIAVVATTYVGASPEEIENLISKPLEEGMGSISNVETITSFSAANMSMVLLQFVDGTDIDMAAVDMRDKLDQIKSSLPDAAGDPMVVKMDMNAIPITLGVKAENLDLNALHEMLEDNVVNRLERIEGVASVSLSGGIEREIRVTVDPTKMAGYGLTTNTISGILAAENMNLPSGSLSQGDTTVSIRTIGEFTSIQDIQNLPIPTATGAVVHLSDVARVEEVEADRSSFSYINGEKGIIISVDKQSTANLVKVSDALKAEMEDLQKDFPELEMYMLTDTAEYIELSLSNITQTAFLAAIIAFFVLFLFLKNAVTAGIIAVSIPTSIMATFAMMYVTGINMNMISMGGVAIGIGMLVDNSVVVLDSIYQYYERGYSASEAAEVGAKEVSMAITASTLTTVAVFVPLALTGGTTGAMMQNLSFTIVYALVASVIVALTFVPMACALLLKREVKTFQWKNIKFLAFLDHWDAAIDMLSRKYEGMLKWALAHRKKTVISVVVVFILSLFCIPLAGMDFMAAMDQGSASVTVTLPNGTDLDTTEETTLEVLYRLQNIEEVDMVYANVGSGMMSAGTNAASVTVNLVEKADRSRSTDEVVAEIEGLLADIAGAEITVASSDAAMGSMGGSDVTMNVYGYDSKTLVEAEKALVEYLETIPGLSKVEGSTGDTVPEAMITIDRGKASQYGITTAAVAGALNTAISGSTATEYKVDGTEIDVVLRYDTEQVNYLTDLNDLTVTSGMGTQVPLGNIATITMGETATTIMRENQKNYITINADAGDMSGNEAQELVIDAMKDFELPEGCYYEFGGMMEMMNESFGQLGVAMVVAVLLVYMIMASQFESLRYPFIVMFSMPLAITGAIFGLLITGNTITMPAMMGFVMLIGMVVNNGIVLVDYTNQLMDRGMNCYDALTSAGPRRLRPILMTTLTTVLGMLPMALAASEGSEMMQALAIGVIFGLTLSTVVTLVFIPVLYMWMNERRRKSNAKRTAKRIAKASKRHAEEMAKGAAEA
ncbi:MAG: efflux RND transporter permease subunit [Bacillota bacterium]|nr:efflux RND transporter permease subunit [Bacillota bacterium]